MDNKISNNITKPEYYKSKTMDVIDICFKFNLSFAEGNIVKYVIRHENKNGVEDLKKAKEYLERLIKEKEQK